MIHIDTRFNDETMEMLRNMLGRTMIKYKCDPFIFSTSVYGIVGIFFKGRAFTFTNTTEAKDYFGTTEAVAIFHLAQTPEAEIKSRLQDEEMIDVSVNNQISEISVINEHQSLFENGVQTYDVWLTRGVIFKFVDGMELSFEKNVWFSEDITIEKGYDLITRFSPVNEFTEDWGGKYRGECTHAIINVTKNTV